MMTPWDEIVGYTCLDCGKWATHWYGDVPICCACHYGEPGDEGNYMAEQAIEMNTRYQKGLPLHDEDATVPLILDLDEFITVGGYKVKRQLDTEWMKQFEDKTE